MNKHKSLDISLRESGFVFTGKFHRDGLSYKMGSILADLVQFHIVSYAVLPLSFAVKGMEDELDSSHEEDFLSYMKFSELGEKKVAKEGGAWYLFLHTKDGRAPVIGNFPIEEKDSRLKPFDWHEELGRDGYSCAASCTNSDMLTEFTFNLMRKIGRNPQANYLCLPVEVMGVENIAEEFGARTNLFYEKKSSD